MSFGILPGYFLVNVHSNGLQPTACASAERNFKSLYPSSSDGRSLLPTPPAV